MFAYKISFIKIVIIWCLLNCISYVAPRGSWTATDLTAPKSGMCECAAFYKSITGNNTLIFSHSPIRTFCDHVGRKKCLNWCTSLADIENASLVCPHLIYTDAIKPMLFIKICKQGWIYGNMTAKTSICCKKGAFVDCL